MTQENYVSRVGCGLHIIFVFADDHTAHLNFAFNIDKRVAGIKGFEILLVPMKDQLFEGWAISSLAGDQELVVRTFAGWINDDDFTLVKFRLHGIVGNLQGKGAITGSGGDRNPGGDIGREFFRGPTAIFVHFVPGNEGDTGNERVGTIGFPIFPDTVELSGIGGGSRERHFAATVIQPDGIDATCQSDGDGSAGRAGASAFQFVDSRLADSHFVCEFFLRESRMLSGLLNSFAQGVSHGRLLPPVVFGSTGSNSLSAPV